MAEETHKPKPRTCPHCGKDIPRLAAKPRDLGLLVHVLVHRVPIESQTTEAWIETARKHCRMTRERLAELRGEPYARFWQYMNEKRARRLAWKQEHGKDPPYGWTPPAPGEPNHTAGVMGLQLYWKKVRPLLARLKHRSKAQGIKLVNRYLAARKIQSESRRQGAMHDVQARLVMQCYLKRGKVSLKDYLALRASMLPDDAMPRRFKRKAAEIGSAGESTAKNAGA